MQLLLLAVARGGAAAMQIDEARLVILNDESENDRTKTTGRVPVGAASGTVANHAEPESILVTEIDDLIQELISFSGTEGSRRITTRFSCKMIGNRFHNFATAAMTGIAANISMRMSISDPNADCNRAV